jgi:RNA polymerase sigma-70 factor (ECF subfamily)
MSVRSASLAELIERHRGELVGYLARMLGDRQEAEDACQEAFVRAHRAFGRLGPDANSRAWLYRIATNTGLNAARRRGARPAPGGAGGAPPPPPRRSDRGSASRWSS